ncbi:uncharacterized protein LOC107040012 [Diachasma alloeum]|uniref:uncharacterized protein LOC107040012 n=1 Tax=Diachasma alloeum TaxID=454923 RepID=UPI0007382C09|nr:uncharacterized protein LOC107040012 [Diachasma alloeum]
MNGWTIAAIACMCFIGALAQTPEERGLEGSFGGGVSQLNDAGDVHTRSKRTLLLKKKILGAGLLGLGLGVAKGYKLGYHHSPEVHHVYLSPPPPPVRYVEYVEKPVYVERIIEKPVFKSPPIDYDHQPWGPPEPSSTYGAW